MDRSFIYIIIAVFLILTIILIWFGMKFFLDTRKHKRDNELRRKAWRDKLTKP